MTDKEGIQIRRGSRQVATTGSQDGIEISRSGKPVSGAAPELVELQLRCGKTRKGFKIILERKRTAQTGRYRVVSILEGHSTEKNKTGSSAGVRSLDININEIDGIDTAKCPYCGGGKHALIKCGCGGVSCGGGVRREGNRESHKCPWCGSVGIIQGYIENLSGERSASHRGLPGGGISQQQLPTNSAPRLRSAKKE